MSRFTIFGAGGFVGRHLVARLAGDDVEIHAVTREAWPAVGSDLGHVIFTIGMTADFREKPFETVESQVLRLAEALRNYRFTSFLYLSSTRLYRQQADTREKAALAVRPAVADDLYNATKLAGEALVLALPNPACRVARLSNLYGAPSPSHSFLAQVVAEAKARGRVTFRTAPDSQKDYLDVESAAAALVDIARAGRHRLYNVASGENVSHAAIGAALARLGLPCDFAPDAPESRFTPIAIDRLVGEFAFRPKSLLAELPRLIASC